MWRQFLLCGLLAATVGCGVQQISPDNRQFMLQLQSVTSAKKLDWLQETARQIEDRRATGGVSDAEYKAFQSIILKAKAGNWTAAQHEAFALSEGQKPTATDLERIQPAARRL